MADVYAVFGSLLALGIAFPGMLLAWWLLFPQVVQRAQARVEENPWRCFWMGLAAAVAIGVPISLLFMIPLPFSRLLGSLGMFAILGLAGMGAAGIALQMGHILQSRAGEGMCESAAFLRAAVALELLAAFPFIGWFLVIPLTIIVSLGAFVFAVLRWTPKGDEEPVLIEATSVPAEA